MSRLEWYKSILLTSKDKLNQENNPVDKTEYERLYTLAFIGCLLLFNSSDSSAIFLTQNDESVFIHYSDEDVFSLNKETAKMCLRKHYEKLKFKEEKIEEDTIEKDTIAEDVNLEKSVEPVEPIIANEPEYIEEEPVFNTGAASEVETVEIEPSIDYSAIITKITEEKKEEIIVEKVITEEQEMKETKEKSIANLYYNENYPRDMSDCSKLFDSFLFDQYLVEAENTRILVNIFPLYYTDNAPISSDIFIVFKSDAEVYRGYKSSFESERKLVRAIFDKYEFIARGKWINGNFESSLTLAKAANVTIQKKSHIPKNRTATTHMITTYDNNILHIFPTDWKNHEKTGVAGALIYSETEDVIMTPNPQTQIPYSKNKTDLIQVYWQGKGEQAELKILED